MADLLHIDNPHEEGDQDVVEGQECPHGSMGLNSLHTLINVIFHTLTENPF